MGWSSQSLLVWGSSIWTWMNVLGFPLFLFCVLAPPKHLISHLMASVAFILWYIHSHSPRHWHLLPNTYLSH
jgi:hypothetical protein